MKMIHMIAALLAMFAPMTQVWAVPDTHSTHYGKIAVEVATGEGTVYVSTSSTATSGQTSGTWDCGGDSSGDSKTWYIYAKSNSEDWEFKGWSTSKTGTPDGNTTSPVSKSVLTTSTQSGSPSTTTYYAHFASTLRDPFDITFAPGNYTVDGVAVGSINADNYKGLRKVKTVALSSSDENFLNWLINNESVANASHTLTCESDTTVEAIFLTADQVTTVTTIADLTSALSNAAYKKIIIPSGTSLTVAKGVTVTVPAGKQLVVDGTLNVLGTVSNSGVISGSGKLYKISYLIDQGELQILYQADGTECSTISGTAHHAGESAHYYKTQVAVNTPSVSGGTISVSSKWGVLLNGETPYEISAQSVKGVRVNIDKTVAANKITSITGSLTSTDIQSGETGNSANWVLFSNCNLKGPARSGETTRLNFNGTIDLCGHTLTFGLARTYSDFYGVFLNGSINFTPSTDFQNGGSIFFNCSSINITKIKGTPTMLFYDCGTAASPATLSFSYQSSAHRKARFYCGYYSYSFNSSYDTSYATVYGGAYTSDPSDYRADKNTLTVSQETLGGRSYYVVNKVVEPAETVVKIGTTEYDTLKKAIAAAQNGDTISCIAAVDITGTEIEIPSGKSITISLDEYKISGGKIINRGTLLFTDRTTGTAKAPSDVSGGTVESDIDNYGTLDFVFGSYSGSIVNKSGGTLTTHNGMFTGTLTKEAGTVNLKGGHFTIDVMALATVAGCEVFNRNSLYSVCEVPNGTMYDTTVKEKAGYGATPYATADHTLLKTRYNNEQSGRANYSERDWKRLAELMAFYQLFNNNGLDPTLVFDRAVAQDSVNLSAATGSNEIDSELFLAVPAGTPYRALTEKLIRTINPLTGKTSYAKTYHAIIEENLTSVAIAVTDKSGNNAGTLCKAMVELWDSYKTNSTLKATNTVYDAGHKFFVLNAGSNKAMIRPATGAATFYATLGDAMDAAADGGRVMLANDCDTALPLTKAGTYTFDTMGFAASDAVSLSDGLFVKSETAVDSSAKVLVPDAKATTYVVAQKVASVGETFYDNLTEAVGAANGATVTLLAATDETITLGEGQTLSLNKNGIAFDDAKVVTSVEGSSVKATTSEGVTVYSLVKDVVTSGDVNYPSIEAAVAATEGGTVAVTVIAADTETIALVAGKTLVVTVADGVTANVTVDPVEGAFIDATTDGNTTTYESKKITVKMEEPQSGSMIEVTKIEGGTETTVSDSSAINAAVTQLMGNHDVVQRTDNTDNLDVLDKITVTPTKIVEEVVGAAAAFIRSATFDVVPTFKAGQSLGEGQKLKFRLPVDAAATQLSAIVYHNGSQFGIYPVQTFNDEKYVEVESDTFSPYGYELLDGETTNPVAAIGTTGYATLPDAIAAVPDGTATTITMLADTAESVTIPGGKSVVLDLNGKTVSCANSTPTISVSANGSLAVADSSTGTSGGVQNTAANGVAIYCDAGSVTVNSGTVGSLDTYRGIVVDHVGTVVVNDGRVIASNAAIRSTSTAHDVITINGGTIGDPTTDYAVYDYDYATITIHGGVLNADKIAIATFGSTLTIDGGEINKYGNTEYAILLGEGGTATISGGTITSAYTGIFMGDNGTTLNITGGTITAAHQDGAISLNGTKKQTATINISGGTVANTGTGAAIYQPAGGTTVNVSGDAVLTGPTGIILKGGTLNISGGTITGNGPYTAPAAVGSGGTSTGDAVYVEDVYGPGDNNVNYAPTVNITGGTLTSVNGYAAQYFTEQTAPSTYKANGSIAISGNATLSSGKQTDAMASTVIPEKVLVSGGSFTHAVPEEYCAEGYIPATQDPETSLYTVKEGSYVAQIGTAKYETLAAALKAANSGDTIEMIADDRLGEELAISRSVTITGAVDEDGKPLYTIYGKPTDNYNVDVFIKNASSAIDVTIQNVNIREFGHQYKTSTGNAALYVSRSTHADTHVLVSNVTFSAYNNYAIIAPQGHLEVVDCAIDGYKDSLYGTFATGGIWSGDMFDDLPSSTVSVVRTSIINTDSNMPGVTGYAIDARAGSTVTVTDCTITNVHDGIAAAASQESGDGKASVSVSGTTVTASRNALAITGNPQIANTVLAYLEVTSGMFAGAVTIPDEFVEDGIIEISGGVFDRAVPEDYCTSGFIPAANTDTETSAAYPYTVKEGAYVAQIVRGGEVIAKYETFAAALEDAESGDTVQLLANVEDVTETFVLHGKNITIDGQGLYSITAGENTEPRSVVQSYSGARNMFVVQSGNVTFKGITLDGGETHYYTFLVQAKNGTTAFDNVSLLHGGEADSSGTAGVGYGAAVQVDGATVLVTNSFYACTGTNVNDVTTGVFPFTALLYQSGGIHFADGVTAGIGDDLLLVGMVGAVDVSTDAGREMVSEMLEAMNVPAGYYPYTLKLGDSEMTSFTGASPLGWNGIIDYGSDIMVAANTSMGMDLNPDTTPVEVGLLADTVLPETFIYEDGNLTVNGNGNALSGTIKYTDDAGTLENVVLGSEGNQLVLDMTGLSAGNSINLGTSIAASNVTIKVTEEQATTLGLAIVTWNTEGESEEAEASLETGIKVVVVNAAGEPVEDPVTGDSMEASIIWDAEMGVAYIGPCEARLTGPTHESPIYTSLASAIARATDTGDTITLLTNVVNVTTTYEISKQDLVIDGAGYTVAAAPVTEHRNMFEAWSGSKNMFKLQTGNITFRNITLDGDETHAYTFLISADNSSVALTTENVRLIHGGEISEDSNNAAVTPGNGYGAAIHLNNGAHLIVSNGFYACTGTNVNGVTTGVFPFTAILPENLEAGTSVAFELTGNPNDPANVDIGDDLLLVGMIGDLIDQYGIEAVQGILNYMKVPSRFIPYTLTLADGSAYAFTGASPRRWNEIIDYGKDIMDVATANGFSGLNKKTTPVEVGLATDTILPADADGDGYDFLYEDSNFSINGNGNVLSGTIKFTDDADGGMLSDIVLGTKENPLTLDLSETDKPVDLGDGVVIQDVVVLMTEDQATLGKVVFDWDENDEEPPDDKQGVTVTVVNSSGEPTGEEKGVIWDEEYGVAYIGPCEARLTGATHETPVYTSLANALDIAKDNDKVELLTNAVLSAVQGVGSDVTLDLAGYKVSVNGEKGLLVTNATLVIADTSVKTNGTICAGDEASPASLIESGNGGTVNIPTGIFAAASGQNVLVTSDNGAFAVSGGYFSNPVLPEHCAESYMPVDAEAGAPQPYTVAEFVNEFRYPIDGSVGVPVERTWLAQNFSDIYSDPTKPVLANVTNALVEALSENGANEMPRWESYVLGLDPTVVTARLRLTATSKDAATVTIKGVIDMTKFPNPEGTTITFRLAEVNPDGTKKKDLVTDSEEPSFDVLLEEVVGKELAIFADIAVEAVAK